MSIGMEEAETCLIVLTESCLLFFWIRRSGKLFEDERCANIFEALNGTLRAASTLRSRFGPY